MRNLVALGVLVVSLASAPAYADLVVPDAGTEDAGGTNNATNNATNNGTAASNNDTSGENNGTAGDTSGSTDGGGNDEPADDDSGCSIAGVNVDGASGFVPMMLGVILLGASRRRRE